MTDPNRGKPGRGEQHAASRFIPRPDVLTNRTFSRALVALTFLCALIGCGRAEAAAVNGDLKIFVLNIGQGDAILIVCPHGTHQMLIGAGARGYPGSQPAQRSV